MYDSLQIYLHVGPILVGLLVCCFLGDKSQEMVIRWYVVAPSNAFIPSFITAANCFFLCRTWQPHINNGLHRQAVPNVDLLSVVIYSNMTDNVPDSTSDSPPLPKVLEPLPDGPVTAVPGTAGSLEILGGRVSVNYGLFMYGDEDEEEQVIQIELQNVEFDLEDEEDSYIGFGFAPSTMSGLVMTCSPRYDADADEVTALCHQWRGLGTNLYPRELVNDAGGWFLQGLESDGTFLNFTLVGRTEDVMSQGDGSSAQLRAICALGRAAPDSGTPLMHTSQDRTPMILNELTTAMARVSTENELQATSSSAKGTPGGMIWGWASMSIMILFLNWF